MIRLAAAFFALTLPVAAAQDSWTQRTPATSPGARVGAALAYGVVRKTTVLFGGSNTSAPLADTWEWNGTTWSKLTPAASPSARASFGFVYDSGRGRGVLFGGWDVGTPGTYNAETWEWDGSNWTQRAPVAKPSARAGLAMAYDSGRSKVVLFGGTNATTRSAETWEFNGTNWAQVTPTTSPPKRAFHAMAFDQIRGRVVLFGGADTSELADTWLFDGTNWTQASPTTSPSARQAHAMAWDAGRGRVVLYGGSAGSSVFEDTWEWDGTSWIQAAPATTAGKRSGQALAYDATLRELMTFGGFDGTAPTATTHVRASGTAATFNSTAYTTGTAPRAVALGDPDSDGDLDLATANEASNDVTLRLNDGTGAFGGTPTTLALGIGNTGPVAIVKGRFDNDTKDDFAVACASSHSIVLVLDPAGTSTSVSILSVNNRPVDLAAGDLDGTGSTDLVVAREGHPLQGGAGVSVMLNNAPPVALTIPAGNATKVVRVGVCDLDGDGDLDAVAVAQGATDHVLLFTNNGSGVFTFADKLVLSTSNTANGLCCGDLDGDGDADLAVFLPTLFPAPNQRVRVYRYTGSGTIDAGDYTATADLLTSGSFAVAGACGDLEGNGLVGFGSSVDLVHVNAGSGTVTSLHGFSAAAGDFVALASPGSGTNPSGLALGDLNADGTLDVVVANQGSNNVTVNLTVAAPLTSGYGSGCAGTGSKVPTIEPLGTAQLGNNAFGVKLASALPNAPALLLFGAGADSLALGGGCSLHVKDLTGTWLFFADGLGERSFVFGVPNDTALIGVNAFFQWAVFDPNGSFASLLALSAGLRVRIGS